MTINGPQAFRESPQKMRCRTTVIAITVAGALVALPSPASADEPVSVNRGACMSQIAPWLKPYQAPGQTNVGPFTIVDGRHHFPPAFDGAAGCSR